MFKDMIGGQTHYCRACEDEARGMKTDMPHTCGKTMQLENKSMDKEKLREDFMNEFTNENWCSCGGEYSSETERQKVLNWFLSKLSLREQELWDKIEGMKKETNIRSLRGKKAIQSVCNENYNSALSDIQKLLKSN